MAMIKVAEYEPADVFAAMNVNGPAVLPDGRLFRRNSARLTLFNTKGVDCVTCGIEGTVFILETHDAAVKPHLNLYAVTSDNKLVLMTKDHIQPRSKGGKDSLDNYNTMCAPCNTRKGDTM